MEPWQTVILSVLFSPTFEDIPQTELIAKKLCYNVCFQISVNTIKNLGGIKEVSLVHFSARNRGAYQI